MLSSAGTTATPGQFGSSGLADSTGRRNTRAFQLAADEGELRRLVPTISQKMLTQQLRQLEAAGIVRRTIHAQIPPHVVYDVEPVERARLEPVLAALCDWGLYWCDKTGARVSALNR